MNALYRKVKTFFRALSVLLLSQCAFWYKFEVVGSHESSWEHEKSVTLFTHTKVRKGKQGKMEVLLVASI